MNAPLDSSVSALGLSWSPHLGHLIRLALEEDLGRGDVTTDAVIRTPAPGLDAAEPQHPASSPPIPATAQGAIVCRQPIVVCGLPLISWIVQEAHLPLTVHPLAQEGQQLTSGAALASLDGPSGDILRIERTVLNFLMRLCGVATVTHRYCQALKGTPTRVVDTRKTLPGWRALDKYAVRCGGGHNHRQDLGSGILIKDNHIAACGSVREATRRARAAAPHPLRVEVEVESLADAQAAVEAGAEVLLLDNMTPRKVQQVATQLKGQVLLEVSGGVTLDSIADYSAAGVDVISVGALTHSAVAVDLSLELSPAPAQP